MSAGSHGPAEAGHTGPVPHRCERPSAGPRRACCGRNSEAPRARPRAALCIGTRLSDRWGEHQEPGLRYAREEAEARDRRAIVRLRCLPRHADIRARERAAHNHAVTRIAEGFSSRNRRKAAASATLRRRGRDSNSRTTLRPSTVFETAPFNRSGTPPRALMIGTLELHVRLEERVDLLRRQGTGEQEALAERAAELAQVGHLFARLDALCDDLHLERAAHRDGSGYQRRIG